MAASDRKKLIREYKENPRPMGVYRVRNTITGKSLIGNSINLPAILNRHRAQLSLHSHANRELQKDWNELGADAFAFEVIDTLKAPERPDYDPADDLRALEELWLEKLSGESDLGYTPKPKQTS